MPDMKPSDVCIDQPDKRFADCPNIKCTYEGWDSETYACQKAGCSRRYKLYDDEMK